MPMYHLICQSDSEAISMLSLTGKPLSSFVVTVSVHVSVNSFKLDNENTRDALNV